jgi:hypothetical protein
LDDWAVRGYHTKKLEVASEAYGLEEGFPGLKIRPGRDYIVSFEPGA